MNLLTTQEALEVLSLKNHRILKYLNDRGLLPRLELGTKTIRYKRKDCEKLLERVEKEGINLMIKP